MSTHSRSKVGKDKLRRKGVKSACPPRYAQTDAHPNDLNLDETHSSDVRLGENGVLVLNHNFEPLNICAVRRGLVLMYLGRAEVIRFSERTLSSIDEEHLVPSVLRLYEQVKRPTPQLKISRKSILARDDFMCQYCSSKSNLTSDHVFPRHRGGETTGENVDCCCLKRNN
ncbi:MAG: hypothetical protein JWN98_1378, partial [Abditibacteriota bacterium]|nr:hypothetical protein [Abditibacteriota bacterium]